MRLFFLVLFIAIAPIASLAVAEANDKSSYDCSNLLLKVQKGDQIRVFLKNSSKAFGIGKVSEVDFDNCTLAVEILDPKRVAKIDGNSIAAIVVSIDE